jgi:hypothetical protein
MVIHVESDVPLLISLTSVECPHFIVALWASSVEVLLTVKKCEVNIVCSEIEPFLS